jgi:hypothetical protein
MGTRELWSDDEEVLFKGRRLIVINGIEELITNPDLADRAVQLTLPRIPQNKRKSEKQFLAEFEAAHPKILGGLLDSVVVGLRNEAGLHLDYLPRMADFALWVTAAEPGLGLAPGTFLTAYEDNRAGANESTLEASPIVPYLSLLIEEEGAWEGLASELLAELEKRVSEKDQKLDSWPKQPNALSNRLRALAPNLAAAGIDVEFVRANNKRTVFIKNDMQRHRHGSSPSPGDDFRAQKEAYQGDSRNDPVTVPGDDGVDRHQEVVTHRHLFELPSDTKMPQGEDMYDSDDVFRSHSDRGSENFCEGCGQPVADLDIHRYTATGVICGNCAEETS